MPVKPIPDGYHAITPYLVVSDAARQIEFLKAAFGAVEIERITGPDGQIMHAEVRIADSVVMIGQARGPHQPTKTTLYHYVLDCDAAHARAVAAGAESIQPPVDQFYGDRSGGVRDAEGNQWWIATHKEDLTREELMRRAAGMGKP